MVKAIVQAKYNTPAKSKHNRNFINHLDNHIPYTPAAVVTSYDREFYNKKPPKIPIKASGDRVVRDFFNIANEKLGPVKHKMKEKSTSQTTFKGYKQYKGTKIINPPDSLKMEGPFIGDSDYNTFYPNWGPQPVFREKKPQYPYYSLPLNGKST